MSESEEASWSRVERLRDLVASAERDLAKAIETGSPTKLSAAAQAITNAGIDLTRLLGRIEEARGDR